MAEILFCDHLHELLVSGKRAVWLVDMILPNIHSLPARPYES